MVAGPPPPYQLHASEKDTQPQMLDIGRQARGKVGKGKGKRVGKGEEGVKTSGGRGRKGSKGRGGIIYHPSCCLFTLRPAATSRCYKK